MKSHVIMMRKRLTFLATLIPLYVFAPATAQEESTWSQAQIDSIQQAQKAFGEGRTHLSEKILNLPVSLALLPVDLTGMAIANTVGWVSEKEIVPKTVDLLTSDDGTRKLFPIYSPLGGAGFKYTHSQLDWDRARLALTLSTWAHNRQRYRFQLEHFSIGPFDGDYDLRYEFLSQEPFYGIGQDSRKSDRVNYAGENVLTELALGRDHQRGVSTRLFTGFRNINVYNGRGDAFPGILKDADFALLPGAESGVRLVNFGAEIRQDSRDHPGRPEHGGRHLLRAEIFNDAGSKGAQNFNFYRITADITRYWHLFYHRSLSLRLAGEFTRSLDDGDIPFYMLSELGRGETVRGFERGRFRDHDLILGALEYRYPIWDFADLFL